MALLGTGVHRGHQVEMSHQDGPGICTRGSSVGCGKHRATSAQQIGYRALCVTQEEPAHWDYFAFSPQEALSLRQPDALQAHPPSPGCFP